MNKEIMLATNNPHKLQEFREILSPLGFTVYSPMDLNIISDPEEIGTTFKENAILKAKSLSDKVPFPVIADDSGFQIEALDGFPGVYSARYAKSLNNDIETISKELNKKLAETTNRKASFVCCIALIEKPGSKALVFEGQVKGEILFSPESQSGFGYDPLFKANEGGLLFGKCSEKQKNQISHRAKAVLKLVTYLSI